VCCGRLTVRIEVKEFNGSKEPYRTAIDETRQLTKAPNKVLILECKTAIELSLIGSKPASSDRVYTGQVFRMWSLFITG
jgi:hypothetical protein